MMRASYHSKNGKFCKKSSANTVTKGGERFKVVRQYRRIKGDSGEERVGRHQRKVPSHESPISLESIALAKEKIARTRLMMGREYVSIDEMNRGDLDSTLGHGRKLKWLVKKMGGELIGRPVTDRSKQTYSAKFRVPGGFRVDVVFYDVESFRWSLVTEVAMGKHRKGAEVQHGSHYSDLKHMVMVIKWIRAGMASAAKSALGEGVGHGMNDEAKLFQ